MIGTFGQSNQTGVAALGGFRYGSAASIAATSSNRSITSGS
jgi:hypothetical protein